MTRCGSVPACGGPRTPSVQAPAQDLRGRCTVRDQRRPAPERWSCGAIARPSRQLRNRTGGRPSFRFARILGPACRPTVQPRSPCSSPRSSRCRRHPSAVGAGPGRVETSTIGSTPVERVVVRWASTAGTERGLSRAVRMTSAHAGTRRAAVVSADTEAWWLPEPLSGASLLSDARRHRRHAGRRRGVRGPAPDRGPGAQRHVVRRLPVGHGRWLRRPRDDGLGHDHGQCRDRPSR